MPDEERGPTNVPELDRSRVGRLPRVLVGLALALPVLLVVGVLVVSTVLQRSPAPAADTERLAVSAVPVPAAATADCARLLSGLPQEINTGNALLPRRVLADPVPAGTVAWGGLNSDSGRYADQPIVLRCGLPRPAELTPTASLLDVDGVEWLQLPGEGASTWVTVDRSVFIGLTLPDGSGSGPIQDVSRGVKITLASRSPTG